MDLYARRNDDEQELWIQRTFSGDCSLSGPTFAAATANAHANASDDGNGYISSSSASLVGRHFVVDHHSACLEYSDDDRSSSSITNWTSSYHTLTSPPALPLLLLVDADNGSLTSQESDFFNDAYFQPDEDFLGKMILNVSAVSVVSIESVEYPPSVSDEGTREGSSVDTNEFHVFEDDINSSDEMLEDNQPDSSFDDAIAIPYERLDGEQGTGCKRNPFAIRMLTNLSSKDLLRSRDARDTGTVTSDIRRQTNMLKRAVRSFRRRSSKRDIKLPYFHDATIPTHDHAVRQSLCSLLSSVSSPESTLSYTNEDTILEQMWREDFAEWGSMDTGTTPSLIRQTDDLNAIITPIVVSHEEDCVIDAWSFSPTAGYIPEGLLSRTPIDEMISKLNLGIEGWSAIHGLESAVTDMSQPFPMLMVKGVHVPDYNTYVYRSVVTFHRDILVNVL